MLKLRLGFVVLALTVVYQTTLSLPAHSYKPGQFPGKGSYEAWKRSESLYKIAVDFCKNGQNEEAIRISKEAIGYYPYEGGYWQTIGIAYTHMKQPQKAEAALRKAIELNPDDFASWNDLANCLDDQNKLEEEREAYYKALACRYPPPQSERAEILQAIRSIDKDLASRK